MPNASLRATPAARVSALLLDGVVLAVVAFVVMVVGYVLSSPRWNLGDTGYTNLVSGGGGAAADSTVPGWVSWAVLLVLVASAVGMSGALKARGRRRSLGMAVAGLSPVRWPLATAGLPAGWRVEDVEPARWRIAARWLLPIVAFAALAAVLGGWLGAALIAVALWSPAVWGPRRSAYDAVLGVGVVDAADLVGLAVDAHH